jgi:transcriptional regulator with XRE-family HTH domain
MDDRNRDAHAVDMKARDSAMTDERTPIQRLREYMREIRKQRGFPMQYCADKGGMPLATWATIEKEGGSTPGADKLMGIAKALDVPAINLLRIMEGKELRHDTSTLLLNLFEASSPHVQGLVLEWLTMPQDQQVAVEAGLASLLTALRQRPGRR